MGVFTTQAFVLVVTDLLTSEIRPYCQGASAATASRHVTAKRTTGQNRFISLKSRRTPVRGQSPASKCVGRTLLSDNFRKDQTSRYEGCSWREGREEMTAGKGVRSIGSNHLVVPPLLRFIPYVQEGSVTRRGYIPPAFVDGAIQRRAHVFLAFRQLRQRHFQRNPCRQLIEIGQDLRNHLLMLSISTLRNIHLRHGLEIHRNLFGPGAHGKPRFQ